MNKEESTKPLDKEQITANATAPVSHFYCHMIDVDKAKKAVKALAKSMSDNPETKKAVLDMPIHVKKGCERNRLLVMNGETVVLVINLKTGESYYI